MFNIGCYIFIHKNRSLTTHINVLNNVSHFAINISIVTVVDIKATKGKLDGAIQGGPN